jgi:DNA-binding NarL/FixJ family response regulator
MTLRLMIVDDNVQFVHAARAVLEREGITVVGMASNSIEALDRFDALRPDVALVDVDLGQESGFDLARRLSERAGGGPVILISTYAEEDLRELIDSSPALGFLSKSDLSGQAIQRLVRPEG